MSESPEPLVADVLAAAPGVRHGFFTRAGGVSDGLFASLNCGFGSGDAAANVAANRARAAAVVGAETVLTPYQVHGRRVAVADRVWAPEEAPRADALVTTAPGLAIGVLTADCAPVLFADAGAGVIGAAHAGWRGAREGVLEETVAAMERLGARAGAVVAAIGPSIARASYEVGPEFPQPFLDQDAANGDLFEPAPRREYFLFDLAGYVARRLAALGLAAVRTLGRDSFAEEDAFFSYRRALRRGEARYGRNLSMIVLGEQP